MFSLFDTLSQKQESFAPLAPPRVSIYSCGPTVYARQHLGNMRPYVFVDTLKRALRLFGYQPRHVINITDVGHLTDDADAGQDKMEVSARRSGESAREIAAHFSQLFRRDLSLLDVAPADIWALASEHIDEQIAMIEKLEARGITYRTADGIYFNTQRADRYGRFTRVSTPSTQVQARLVGADDKRNPADFALWKFSRPEEQRQMEWPSPWGVGFPGWHIECSAMASKHLGAQFDIHTGGVDHIPIHHENELAQAEGALGVKPWVRYWLHSEWVVMQSQKLSKSQGGAASLDDVIERGIEPLAYRLLLLGARYRQRIELSWDSLRAAQRALERIGQALMQPGPWSEVEQDKAHPDQQAWNAFKSALADDLNTPRALAVLYETLSSRKLSDSERQATAGRMTNLLGLQGAARAVQPIVDESLERLLEERERARAAKDYERADRLRARIQSEGYEVMDGAAGARLRRSCR